MSSLRALCNRRQFQLYLLAGLCLSHIRPAAAREPASRGGKASLVRANNEFALELLRDIESHAGGANLFFSPFSIESALSIALEGARGQTALEIGKVLEYPDELHSSSDEPWDMPSIRADFQQFGKKFQPPASEEAQRVQGELAKLRQQLAKANAAAEALQRKNQFQQAAAESQKARQLAARINQLATEVDQFELYNANSLWLDASYPLSKKYQNTIDEFYGTSGAFSCDFQRSADAERKRINAWVGEHTREKIKDIIPAGALTALTRLVIANAIYFKGTWSQPFDAEQTKPAPFTTSDLKQHAAPLMQRHGFAAGRYAAFNADGSLFDTPRMVDESFHEERGYPDRDGFQVAELPYNGDRLSMMIVLPRRADGLAPLVKSLTAEKLQACAEQLAKRSFHISLPRFKLETTYELNKPLQRMGMQQAFDSEKADFSGLTESRDPDHELHVSIVLHKAFVDVNEQGTEAAAATIVAMEARAAFTPQQPFVPSFTADHPFLFVIREKDSGMVLFMGKVEKP